MTSVEFAGDTGLQPLVESFSLVADSVMHQVKERNLDVAGIQRTPPSFRFDVNASGKGLVGQYLHTMGMSIDTVYAHLSNDSLISGHVGLLEASNGTMRADTLSLNLRQRGKLLDYYMHMGNRSNNSLAEFADVNLNGYFGSNRVLLSMTQFNQKGRLATVSV